MTLPKVTELDDRWQVRRYTVLLCNQLTTQANSASYPQIGAFCMGNGLASSRSGRA